MKDKKALHAKIKALEGLRDQMDELGGSSLMDSLKGEGAMKATVIAKDKEGLEEGLEKASEIVDDEDEEDSKTKLAKLLNR